MAGMRIYIGADHGGYELKQELLEFLEEEGYETVDVGAESKVKDDSFVGYAAEVAEGVAEDEDSRGIVICRNGVGVSIVANRFAGIRCGLGFNRLQIEKARSDDNINMLALPADYLPVTVMKEITEAFLQTEFSGEEKYLKRLRELEDVAGGCGSGCCGGGCSHGNE